MDADLERLSKQYKFCFKCGGKLKWESRKLFICASCGFKNYINPSPVNAAILENDNHEILLVERKVDPAKGFWDLPGGFVDYNENAEESVRREILEELNCEIYDLKYFCSAYDLYPFDGVVYATFGIIFSGKIGKQKLEAKDDAASFKFFKKDQIPYERLAFEGLKKALKKYTNG